MTRIESNTLNLKMQRVNLNETIKDIVIAFRIARLNDSDEKNVMISCEFNNQNYRGEKKEKAIFVRADKLKLLQVISYLINNAIKFLKQRPEVKESARQREEQEALKKDDNETKIENAIRISLERNDSQKEVTVNIKDSGTGIDAEILPRLFSKFVAKSFEGIGLGLYICKGIIEAHGGKIWVKNNDEREKGATFSFTLPLDILTS